MNQITMTSQSIPSAASPTALEQCRIAFISANWHTDVVHAARNAAMRRLTEWGAVADRIHLLEVPGAFEIPLMAHKLAACGKFQAVIACAVVVDGGIYRHEFVSAAVIDGLMRVQLDTGVPVFSAVLTPCNFHAHEDHLAFFRAHFVKKGVEVADACANTLAQHAAVDALLAHMPRV